MMVIALVSSRELQRGNYGMRIEDVQALCTDETILITQHMLLRFRERGIKIDDVMYAILHGEVIEDYPDDYPHPSCLVLGASASDKMLHIVCGLGEGRLWIITAYYPDPAKWELDFKTRKELLK
jgi:hypothetical protein